MTQTFTSGQVLTAEATNGELAFPTGSMFPFAGASAPAATVGGVAAWLLCNGAAVSRTTYATLFAVLGSTYGAGDGSTTFNVPDLRGRIPMGAGTGTGLNASGTGAPTGTAQTARTRGEWLGEETHLLTGAESGTSAHVHPGDNGQFWVNPGGGAVMGGGGFQALAGRANTGTSTQANAANRHATVPPVIITNYLIKT
jgi:microcystin-dependent protein